MPDPLPHNTPHPPQPRLARLGRLALKELREILRDRRTIVTLVLMPLLLYPLLSLVFQQLFLSQASQLTQSTEYRIGFINEAELNVLLPFLQLGGLKLAETDPTTERPVSLPQPLGVERPEPRVQVFTTDQLERHVRELGLHVGVRLRGPPPVGGFDPRRDLRGECDLAYNTGSRTSREAVAFVEECLAKANAKFLEARLQHLGISQPAQPIRSTRLKLEHWEALAPAVSITAIVPFVLILMTITGAVYPSIDLTAGERERGTLEMLVSAPIPRMSLLFAKYLAVLSVALLTAIVNLVMMFVTLAVTGLGRQLLGDAGLSLDIVISVFGLLLLFAAFFSAVLLALTSFARSFKEAQAYLIPLMLGSLAPAILGLMPGMKLSGLLLITPLVNIVLLGRDLLEMQATLLGLTVVVGSTVFYSVAAISVAARVFGAESVLYGRSLGWSDLFRKPTNASQGPSLTQGLFTLALLFPVFYLTNSGIARVAEWNLQVKLPIAALMTVLVFAGIPILACRLRGMSIQQACRLSRPTLFALVGSVLLGLSLWTFAHEVVVLEQHWGLVSFDSQLLVRAKQVLEEIRHLPMWLVVLCIGIIPAVCEELFFRGYLFQSLRTQLTSTATIWTSAILFGLFHLVATDALAVERLLPSTIMGLALGWVAAQTGSTLPGMILHACHNSFLITVSYYQPQLTAQGWGLEDAQHIPLKWLATAAALSFLGALCIRWGRSSAR